LVLVARPANPENRANSEPDEWHPVFAHSLCFTTAKQKGPTGNSFGSGFLFEIPVALSAL
jgi:hypothetical protein